MLKQRNIWHAVVQSPYRCTSYYSIMREDESVKKILAISGSTRNKSSNLSLILNLVDMTVGKYEPKFPLKFIPTNVIIHNMKYKEYIRSILAGLRRNASYYRRFLADFSCFLSVL